LSRIAEKPQDRYSMDIQAFSESALLLVREAWKHDDSDPGF
jgi:hypothetical protein